MNFKPLLIAGGFALGLTGCTMMPDYQRPAAPLGDAFPGNTTQTTVTQAVEEIPWQEFFQDPQLRNLIGLALENNRDLRIAALRVEQTRAQYQIQRAALYPGLQGNISELRQKTSGTLSSFNDGTTRSTFNVNVGVSYEVDLFGRVRSLKTEALEKFFASEEARKSAQIALVSEVATQYLTRLQLQEAQAIAAQTLEAAQSSHSLIQRRFELGVNSELEVRTAESQVQTARVAVVSFSQYLAQTDNALVLLVGQSLPADLFSGQTTGQAQFPELNAGLPSEVLLQRPDVLAAEHTLKAANANIGAARAAYFPRILLTGSGGVASAKLSDLFTGPSATWSFTPQITVPIFEFGSTKAKLNTSKVSKQIEVATYEKAIQTAFREVADALAVRAVLGEKVEAQQALRSAQQKRFDLTSARYSQGVDNYLDVLLAQRDLYAAQQNLLEFQVARLQNSVALYRALGGGWNN